MLLVRRFHHKRVPNYNGWWTQILNGASSSSGPIGGIVEPSQQHQQQLTPDSRMPIPIPFAELTEPAEPSVPAKKPRVFVNLKGAPIELPEKPDPPENCCMSGCVHCVWDMYQEEMEEYSAKKKELKDRFIEAGEPIPKELDPSKTSDPVEEMDPTMKAFLEMEKKLNGK